MMRTENGISTIRWKVRASAAQAQWYVDSWVCFETARAERWNVDRGRGHSGEIAVVLELEQKVGLG